MESTTIEKPAASAPPAKPPMLTEAQLRAIMPKVGERAGLFLPHLLDGIARFGIQPGLELAMFLPQVAHESGDLTALSEGMNYSAQRLAEVWPNRFATATGAPNAAAKKYANKPEALANNVYANRFGNGDEASGDGWLFRGSGGIGVTFRANAARVAKFFGKDVATVSEWMRSPEGAVLSACWYWWQAGCAKAARAGDFDQVCDLINLGRHTEKQGDAIGYADRRAKFIATRKVLGC